MMNDIIRKDIREFLTEEYIEVLNTKDNEIKRLKEELEKANKREVEANAKVESRKGIETQVQQLVEQLKHKGEEKIEYLLLCKYALRDYPTDYDDYSCSISYTSYETLEKAIEEERKYREKIISNRNNLKEKREREREYHIDTLIIPYIPSGKIGEGDLERFIQEYYIE